MILETGTFRGFIPMLQHTYSPPEQLNKCPLRGNSTTIQKLLLTSGQYKSGGNRRVIFILISFYKSKMEASIVLCYQICFNDLFESRKSLKNMQMRWEGSDQILIIRSLRIRQVVVMGRRFGHGVPLLMFMSTSSHLFRKVSECAGVLTAVDQMCPYIPSLW